MAGVCFYFESSDVDVWSGKDLDAWNLAFKVAGDIDRAIVVNLTDQEVRSPDGDLDFQVVKELPEFDNAAYIVCPWDGAKSVSLNDFNHDVDWYVFGPASGWHLAPPGLCVTLPQSGEGACHSVHVATAVMFSRFSCLAP